MKKYLLLFSVFVSAVTLQAASSGVPELDRYKSIYERELERLAAQAQSQRLRIPQEHIKALSKLEEHYRQAGDLRNLLAVRNERKRFISDPRIDSITPVQTPAKLRALQIAYIRNYKTIRDKRKQDIAAIRNKYIGLLQELQKKLTREDRIDEALTVMKEIEFVQAGGNAVSVSATDLIAGDESTSEDNAAPDSVPVGDRIDTATIKSLLKGNVTRWNPYKNEITITYDFSDPDQAVDWKGGRISGIRGRLSCNRTVAWLKLQFSDIRRIGIDIIPSVGNTAAGMVVGRNDLVMKISKDRTLDGAIYQGGLDDPVVKIVNIPPSTGRPYHSVITFNGNQVSWNIDNGRTRHGMLKEPLTYPTFIGLGTMSAESSYGSITITGTLSKKMMARLKNSL